MSSDLKVRSSELICWLTADWVTWLICAALVKLSVSTRSQKTFKLSICIRAIKQNLQCRSTLFMKTALDNPPILFASAFFLRRFKSGAHFLSGDIAVCRRRLAGFEDDLVQRQKIGRFFRANERGGHFGKTRCRTACAQNVKHHAQ